MNEIEINGYRFPYHSYNTIIIGSGVAALNAAARLHGFGQKNTAIVTDHWGGGTSNNTGSDKQTYYKLSLAGGVPDSSWKMAEDLFAGGSMHGDIALCEAQNSLQCFYNLVELGVPFPFDKYGAFIGYKTDHDPMQRGTSAGPKTSQMMFQCLAGEVKARKIEIFDKHEIIGFLTAEKQGSRHVIGAVALDRENLESPHLGFVVFNAVNIIMGTGGPAGIYKNSVYPLSQLGSTGLALEIGAKAHNLTESQFGIGSIKFRWNLSGSYQQVIPRYVSTDQNGGDEREFLNPYFPDMGKLASAVFLKGYQWPFDPRKVFNYGSSLIDILVYQETVLKERRVFLDFTHNPEGNEKKGQFSFDALEVEAQAYLKKSGALFGRPIDRLEKMNRPAIDLYLENGIDISKELLEIAVCAQHNNGGLKGNLWWESNIKHLFPVGEVNGTHGVYRPGGSALNSGQVGGMRAALFVAKRYDQEPPDAPSFLHAAREQIKAKFRQAFQMIDREMGDFTRLEKDRIAIQKRMSACGGHIRRKEDVRKAVEEAYFHYQKILKNTRVKSSIDLPFAFKNLDLGLTYLMYLEAVKAYLEKGGGSRGSYLVLDKKGIKPCSQLGDKWKFILTEKDSYVAQHILEIWKDNSAVIHNQWVPVKPVPEPESWFETVWYDFRNDLIVKEE
jgi:succinate dehydrogenase/fumarate reductase flavoprotein subunit